LVVVDSKLSSFLTIQVKLLFILSHFSFNLFVLMYLKKYVVLNGFRKELWKLAATCEGEGQMESCQRWKTEIRSGGL
jgi:hypothetical protein